MDKTQKSNVVPQRVKYRVIHDNYKDHWQAWLDGELQILNDDNDSEWEDVTGEPLFSLTPDCYRRKPKIKRYTPVATSKTSLTTSTLVEDYKGEYVRYEDIKHLL